MTNLYQDYCKKCADEQITLSLKGIEKAFQSVLNSAEKAYKKLHKKGSYKSDDITQYSELIDETYKTFSKALDQGIEDNVIPTAMRQSLNNDTFVFSALKTHAQLFEASRLLTNEDGNIKSFQKFSQDIEKLKKDYNQNYLEAEYQFAVSSAQNAAKWAEFESDGDRYNLQYRTAGDDRVRDSHDKLRGITLPLNDPFWDLYAPQNGWRCRCKVIQVRKKQYPESDPVDAMAKGDTATTQIGKDGKNRMEIFRFNPGKSKVAFPPKHPYRLVQDAQEITSNYSNASKETKRLIFEKPINEQYKKLYNSKTGGSVEIHELVGPDNRRLNDDFIERIEAAKVFADQGRKVKVLPEVHKDDKAFRKKLLPNYEHFSKNPDFLVDTEYVDLKRPKKWNNIISNANNSSQQKSIALIMNDDLKINKVNALKRAESILINNKDYSFSKVYFIFDRKLYTYKIQQGVVIVE